MKILLAELDITSDEGITFIKKRLLSERGVSHGGSVKVRGSRCLIGVGMKDGLSVSLNKIVRTASKPTREQAGPLEEVFV